MAQLQFATAPAAPAPVASYHDAIRSMAFEQIEGEDVSPRANALARAFGLDTYTVQADIDQAADLLN